LKIKSLPILPSSLKAQFFAHLLHNYSRDPPDHRIFPQKICPICASLASTKNTMRQLVPAASQANKWFALAALFFQQCQFRGSRQSFRHVLDTILKGLQHMQKSANGRIGERIYLSRVRSYQLVACSSPELQASRRSSACACSVRSRELRQ
jgi:hypothetical protein